MIGKYLKMIRLAAGKKSGEFAVSLGVTPSYYSLVETGKKTPLRRTLHDWARRLGISKGAIDFLALGTPQELSGDDKRIFEALKGELVQKIFFRFLEIESKPLKEVGA